MNCMAKYKDLQGNIQAYYWVSYTYGTKKDCIKNMKLDGIKFSEILEIYTSC